MATNICENDRCTYHRPLPVKDAGAPCIHTIEDTSPASSASGNTLTSHVGGSQVELLPANAKVSGAGTASDGLPG